MCITVCQYTNVTPRVIYVSLMITSPTTRRLVACIRSALDSSGVSVRAAEARAGLPQRAIQNVIDGRDPHLSRAAEICAALGYELVLRPRDPAARSVNRPPDSQNRARDRVELADSPSTPVAEPILIQDVLHTLSNLKDELPVPAVDPVSNQELIRILAVLVDEWSELNLRGREALAIRFWDYHPDLRERAARRTSPPLKISFGAVKVRHVKD